MNSHRTGLGTRATAVISAALLIQSSVVSIASARPQAPAATTSTPAKIPNDQLDSLVAPIALYPDPLLAQVLAASTYPLEIVQLQQWMEKHPELKGEALASPPLTTALGALLGHITGGAEADLYQPMNVNFGLFPPIEGKKKKADRKKAYTERAAADLLAWRAAL